MAICRAHAFIIAIFDVKVFGVVTFFAVFGLNFTITAKHRSTELSDDWTVITIFDDTVIRAAVTSDSSNSQSLMHASTKS